MAEAIFDDVLVPEFERVFGTGASCERLLIQAGIQPDMIGIDRGHDFSGVWNNIRNLIDSGALPSAMPLVQAALTTHPFNAVFRNWRDSAAATIEPDVGSAAADIRSHRRGFRVMIVSNNSMQSVLAAARHAQHGIGSAQDVELGLVNDTFVGLVFPTATAEQIGSIRERLAIQLAVSPRSISIRSNDYQDYFMDLSVEGPDQMRFEINDVPASTPVGEIGRGLINAHYPDRRWPLDEKGKPRDVVIDKVHEWNVERLKPDKSLDDSVLPEGDIIRVSPEGRSGNMSRFSLFLRGSRDETSMLDRVISVLGQRGIAVEYIAPGGLVCGFQASDMSIALELAGQLCRDLGISRDAIQLVAGDARDTFYAEWARSLVMSSPPDDGKKGGRQQKGEITKFLLDRSEEVASRPPIESKTDGGRLQDLLVEPAPVKRLNPNVSLYESGVREGDILRVSPEGRAG